MENMEFEEKFDIGNLVLPSEIKIRNIKLELPEEEKKIMI